MTAPVDRTGLATLGDWSPPVGGAGLLGDRAVLVPVKAFSDAKRRLGPTLSEGERQSLVREMAALVVAAAAPLPATVVCDDPEVADWARAHGALVVWEPGRGLNGAVEAGVQRLALMGVQRVVVAHGDLPHASGLAVLGPSSGVTLVPDRHGDGTNVIELPADAGFQFSYGPGSFQRHLAECDRLGLEVHVLRSASLGYDVDSPADLWPGRPVREPFGQEPGDRLPDDPLTARVRSARA